MFRPVIARSPGGFGTLRTLKAWLAVAAALSGALAAASCNFNAAVVVNLPRWKADDKSVVFVGARPQASCSGDPSKLTLAFLLRDDRGNGRLLTLDGRLGRVTVEEYASIRPEDVQRPKPLSAEAEAEDQKTQRIEDFE